jgi:HAD superfamily hydrolase (TIGR01549 family)
MERNHQVFTEERYDLFKQVNKSLWLEFEKGSISKNELFETRFRRLFEECGCDTETMDLLRINSDFIDTMSQNGAVMTGALGFLQKIADDLPDASIYIITNGVTRNAMGRIASTGLQKYIRKVFISDAIGFSKPSPEYFKAVKNEVNEPDDSYLVIGDSLSSDMLGAKNAALASCWFMPEGKIEEAIKEYEINYTASSFDELYEIIREWASVS